MSSNRWRIALHESGHAVACLALGGRCTGVVLLDDGSEGIAEICELLGDRDAFAVAAGPAAESLVDQFTVPDVAITLAVVSLDNFESLPIFESSPYLATQMARTAGTRSAHISDARRLALWAITGREDLPERWAGLVEHAHQVAAEIVRHNAAAIVRIAEQLFVSGSLAESEVKALFEGQSR